MPSAKHLLRVAPLASLLLLPLCAGCLATYGEQQSQAEAALRADMRILQENNQQLKGRLESYDLEIERLSRTVEALRAAPGAPSASDVQALQQRVNALETQLRTLDQARERDKKEIIDTLSSKLSQIANSSRPAPVRPAATGKRVAQQEGYEHVVEAGQNLSAIAAAYNVSTKSIIEANNLAKPDQIRVGQKLFIPAP